MAESSQIHRHHCPLTRKQIYNNQKISKDFTSELLVSKATFALRASHVFKRMDMKIKMFGNGFGHRRRVISANSVKRRICRLEGGMVL